MSSTYVTASGLVVPTYNEIKTALETDFQSRLGTDIDLSPEGAIGHLVDLMTKSISDVWLGAQEIYTARDPNQAVGTSLDYIAAETGVRRIDATPTAVYNAICYGVEGTIIAVDKAAKQTNGTLNFLNQEQFTITATAARDIYLEVDTVTEGATYTVTLDSIDFSYVAQVGDEEEEILDGLAAAGVSGDPNDFITNGGTITREGTELRVYYLYDDFSLSWDAKLAQTLLGSAGRFDCEETGVNPVAEQSLTVIVTPVSGWNSINNPDAGVNGRAVETDSELRIRRAEAFGTGSATEPAIRQKLLNTVDGIASVSVTSNRTDTTDGDGRPPHSFECVVSGGTDQDVADTIWREQPAGIQPYGTGDTADVEVIDSEGRSQSVGFSRPTNVYLWIKVRRKLYSEEDFPGDQAIEDAILEWAATEYQLGKDVIYQRIGIPVYSVSGVGEIEITVDVTPNPGDTPTYVAANQSIDPREIAVADATRITIEVLP